MILGDMMYSMGHVEFKIFAPFPSCGLTDYARTMATMGLIDYAWPWCHNSSQSLSASFILPSLNWRATAVYQECIPIIFDGSYQGK